MKQFSQATLLAQADHFIDEKTGAVTPPIYHSSTFARDRSYHLREGATSYGRRHNPTHACAERLLAKLEGGAEALLFSSGVAAATALFESLTNQDHLVVPRRMYHGLRDWLLDFSERWGLQLDFYDGDELQTLERALKPGTTRLVWVETPSNPEWSITDISAVCSLAHQAGAQVAADSTMSTPILTRPIELGVDYVFHSATKYLNGHSDLIAGVLICKEADSLWEQVRFRRSHGGAILAPLESWLLLRGMRTLDVRMRRACDNASKMAEFLQRCEGVEKVLYPGLETHPGHQIAARQMKGGFGAVLSFLVKGGATRAVQVACQTELFLPATSLGGVESLIEHRASIEGPNSTAPVNLLRLSLGIEDGRELMADIQAALEKTSHLAST